MPEKILVRPSRAGPVLRLARAMKGLLTNREASQAKREAHCPSGNGASRSVEISGFLPPTKEIEAVFSGVELFPYIDVYVHGSWADDTRTAFSDLDDLVVIDRGRIENDGEVRRLEAWLTRVDVKFCRIDPLQHHGHWIVYSDQLDHYDESYIPLTVLDGAICIQGPATIRASIDEKQTIAGLRRNTALSLGAIHHLYEKYRTRPINVYDMKRLVGSFLLVPAYAFQVRGDRVSKRWALENSEQIYSKRGQEALECCSSIRDGWHRALESWGYLFLSHLAHLMLDPHLYRWVAGHLAPRFPKHAFPELRKPWVESFIEDTQRYTNAC